MPRSIVLLLLLALLPLLALGSRERGVRRRRSKSLDRQSPRPSDFGDANGVMKKRRVGIHDAAEAQLVSSSNKSSMGAAVHHNEPDRAILSSARRPKTMVFATETAHRRLEGFDSHQGRNLDTFLPDVRHKAKGKGTAAAAADLEAPVAAQEQGVAVEEDEEGDKSDKNKDVETMVDDTDDETLLEGKDKETDDDELAIGLGNETMGVNITNITLVTVIEGGKEEDLFKDDDEEMIILEAEESNDGVGQEIQVEAAEKEDKKDDYEDEEPAKEDKIGKEEVVEDEDEIGDKDDKEDTEVLVENAVEQVDIPMVGLSNVTNATALETVTNAPAAPALETVTNATALETGTNVTAFETVMPTEVEDMDEGGIAVDVDTEAPSDNVVLVLDAAVRDGNGDDFFVKPEPMPGLVLIEPEPCIPLKDAYWYMSNFQMNEAKCMEDPNSCSGGCCRLDDHVRCDENNLESNLQCICNQNTGANNLNTNINKLLRT